MTERKQVLFLITKATGGGAQKYVFDLATNLPKDRFEATVAYGEKGKLTEQLHNGGLRTVRIPALGRDVALVSDVMSYFQIRRVIRHARPHVVHLNSSKAAAIGALAARLAGVPNVVFTVHGWPFNEPRNALLRVLIFVVSWFTASISHRVIVVSAADLHTARRMLSVRRKVVHIPLGLPPIPFAAPDEAFRAMFGELPVPQVHPSTVRIVSNSELTKNKGMRYGLDALEHLRGKGVDFIYVVAGNGEDRAMLEEKARKAGIADSVFFPGYVEGAARNLRGFDVFLLPSLKEGMPYSLMEAAAAGIPAVASDIVREDFGHFPQCIFFPSGNSLALSDAIERAAKMPHQNIPTHPFPLGDMVQATILLYLPAQAGR